MAIPVDLKRLIQLINDQKDLKANLILDEGCMIHTDDQTTLVKILNYLLNFLSQITDSPLQISLDLMGSSSLLSLMAFTSNTEVDEISENVKSGLAAFNGNFETIFEPGKHLQIKISFQHS